MARSKAPAQTSLKDVAKRVGVHASTASRVLNPSTRGMVSPDVAAKVLAAADELGYRPNPFALGLRTRRSFTVGVVVPDLTNPVFPPMVRGIEKVLGAAGFTVILADAHVHGVQERLILERMKSRWVDGLILATATRTSKAVTYADAEKVPVVLINRVTNTQSALSVGNDDDFGMRLAVDHIVDLGHRRIAYVAGPQDTSTGYARYQGFLKALEYHHIKPEPKYIAYCEAYSEEAGRTAARKILSHGMLPTAIVCGNDLLALGCYDVLHERKLQCPDDVSVTGFNDMPFIDRINPPMTTVRVPMFEMGELAAHLLLEAIRAPGSKPKSKIVVPTLIVRQSTTKAAMQTSKNTPRRRI